MLDKQGRAEKSKPELRKKKYGAEEDSDLESQEAEAEAAVHINTQPQKFLKDEVHR